MSRFDELSGNFRDKITVPNSLGVIAPYENKPNGWYDVNGIDTITVGTLSVGGSAEIQINGTIDDGTGSPEQSLSEEINGAGTHVGNDTVSYDVSDYGYINFEVTVAGTEGTLNVQGFDGAGASSGGISSLTVQGDAGTPAVLNSVDNVLDLTSSDASITITATAGTDSVDFVSAGGSGDVTGPSSSVDNEIVRFDSTTGKIIQAYTSNGPTVSDSGLINVPAAQIDMGASNSGILYSSGLVRLQVGGTNFFDGNATACFFRRRMESRVSGSVSTPALSLDYTGGNDCGFYAPNYASAGGNAVGVAANSVESAVFTEDGVIFRVEDAVFDSAELDANQAVAYTDETGNLLIFKVKYNDGTTVKTGSIALS